MLLHSNPLSDETRIQNVVQTGNSYEFTIELNDGDMWIPYERNVVYFDNNGKDTAWTVAEHNGTSYALTTKITKVYNSAGKLTSATYFNYDAGDWNEFLERTITYNGNQRVTDKFTSDFSGSTEDVYKYEYTYVNNKLDSMVFFENGQSGFEPVTTHKITIGNDGGINQIKTYKIPDGETEFEMAYRAVFTGGTAVGLKQVNQNQVAVFPNPASTNLTIQVKDGGVYQANIVDLQGRTLLSSTVTAEQATLNVTELNNGLYFLVLTDSFGNSSQNRLVIAK
ncbi:MAG: T9SS C-terminal target domain-containing protein [Bacteroidetes bacterium]|nr:MAG: T9SS C-terminal target domain-containing protein [Bacteroidota bacterium]